MLIKETDAARRTATAHGLPGREVPPSDRPSPAGARRLEPARWILGPSRVERPPLEREGVGPSQAPVSGSWYQESPSPGQQQPGGPWGQPTRRRYDQQKNGRRGYLSTLGRWERSAVACPVCRAEVLDGVVVDERGGVSCLACAIGHAVGVTRRPSLWPNGAMRLTVLRPVKPLEGAAT